MVRIVSYEMKGITNDHFYIDEPQQIEVGSLDMLEFAKNESHTHQVGGDFVEQQIAEEFYQNEHVQDVYVLKKGEDLYIYLILREEADDLAYDLAALQVHVQKRHKDVFIELDYSTEEDTCLAELQKDYCIVPRR